MVRDADSSLLRRDARLMHDQDRQSVFAVWVVVVTRSSKGYTDNRLLNGLVVDGYRASCKRSHSDTNPLVSSKTGVAAAFDSFADFQVYLSPLSGFAPSAASHGGFWLGHASCKVPSNIASLIHYPNEHLGPSQPWCLKWTSLLSSCGDLS
jgi:hypothetical protein